MSINNNKTAETIVKGSTFQETVREDDNYPDAKDTIKAIMRKSLYLF